MSKVAIVNPPFIINGRYGIRAGSRWPFTGTTHQYYYCPYPMWMGYAAAYLQSKGHEVFFYDAIAWRDGYDVFMGKVRNFNPDYIIQEISYPSIDVDLSVAEKLSEIAKVALCGTYASVVPEYLAAMPFVHAVFEGTYEEHALELANNGTAGIYSRGDLINLDNYPWPFRAEYMKNDSRSRFTQNNNAYTMYYDPCIPSPEPMLFTSMSRGCPFKCDFCLWPNTMYNNKVVWRNPENVLKEIEHFVRVEGYRSIYFDDDTQNACGWTRMKQLCDGMKDIGVPWLMLGRLDINTEDEFQYMIDHGCTGMRLGVESLSQKQLDRMKKGTKVEDIKKKIEFLKSRTNLYLLFMHGFPGETQEERDDVTNYVKELGVNSQNPMCCPFPGTPLFDTIAKVVPEIQQIPSIEFDGNNLSSRLKEIIETYNRRVSNG